MIDFYIAEEHFKDHMNPVFNMLAEAGYAVRWITKEKASDSQSDFAVVAANGDLIRAADDGKIVFFMEHGAGQSYNVRHASYAGGPNRENVCLFLDPGPHVTAANALYYPEIPSVKVGVPKLDKRHLAHTKEPRDPGAVPVVAFSFHWDCVICPETGSGFEYFKSAVAEIAELANRETPEFKIIGHSHPRCRAKLKKFYADHNVEFVENFEEVMDRADVYVCDNSSTIFEFASIGKPVVLMNPPSYRKFVNHGLRFWKFETLGPNADSRAELLPAIRTALQDSVETKAERDKLIRQVYYSLDGKATERAVEAILSFIEETKRLENEGNYIKCVRTALGPFGLLDPGQKILIFPSYGLVYDTKGKFMRRVKFARKMETSDRIRAIIKAAPLNYTLVEPDPEILMEAQKAPQDYSGQDDGFVPADKQLTEDELFIIEKIGEGLSKTKIVYKSKRSTASMQRAWDRLEQDEIIVPGDGAHAWEVQKWGP